jgi:Fic family protein
MSSKSENEDTFVARFGPREPAGPFDAGAPYDALPALPPPEDVETKPVLRQCIRARAALAELKQAVQLIPDPRMLLRTLPVLEARDSSEIENVVTTADQLFRHLDADGTADPPTREALRYREALIAGMESLQTRPLCTGTAEGVCSTIKGTPMRVRTVPGTNLQNAATGAVIYTPPVGEARLREMLANWERFLHTDSELDPLIRMAVGHYQFEAIHPFTDGNGRTGRVLNSLFLIQSGLLPLPILYLSRYIIGSKSDYYRLLLDVTRTRAWEPWLLYFLHGVEQTAAWTTAKVAAIRGLAEHTAAFVRDRLSKIYSMELIQIIFQRPYCRITDLVDAEIAQRQAASRYLKALAQLGVLAEHKSGRERLFVHPKLLQLLTRDSNVVTTYD